VHPLCDEQRPVRQDSATPHLKAGATWADNPKALAAQSQVLFTSLPGPPEIEAVALGSNGLIEGMEKGSAWFDLTTNSPTLVRRRHQTFSERGLHLLSRLTLSAFRRSSTAIHPSMAAASEASALVHDA